MRRPTPLLQTDPAPARRGAMLVLVAALISILLTMTVFSVDVAYMQLVRTQLRVATDSAAKAGVETLTRTQDSGQAVAAAIAAASRNEVAGRPLTITASDIVLGRGQDDGSGNWTFSAGSTPYTAMRVNAAMNDGTAAGSVDLMFAKAIGSGKYTPTETSTASHLDQEIVLCVDRSHSMAFDLSGISWRYPSGHGTKPHTICFPPHATLSRWASLKSACQLFLDTVAARALEPRVALVTWGSTIGKNTTEYSYTGRTEVAVAVDMPLTNNFAGLMTPLTNRGKDVMLGGTDMSSGIDAAVGVLTANGVRPLASKTIVLMTDGEWNTGRNPTLAAADAHAAGIVIHTVTFLSQSDTTTMQAVANITGGKHYHAKNQAELEAAFRTIALTLPIVLTE